MDFSNYVASAVFSAHVLERALHSDGPWAMQVGEFVVLADRTFDGDGVLFEAHFPPHCWLMRPQMLTLLDDGEEVTCRWIEPSDAGFHIRWGLDLLVAAA